MNSLVSQRPSSFIPGYAPASARIRHDQRLAEGVGVGLRAYPRHLATGLLLESPWIQGTASVTTKSGLWDTRRSAVY